MVTCKACGCEIEAQDGLQFCPSCLLADALEDDAPTPQQRPSSGTSFPLTSTYGRLASRLGVRQDFFDKYSILRRVGAGGQGEVWEVWDFQFRRTLAMKRLSDEMMQSNAACYRFIAEAQLASQLKHPGILPIYDLGLDPDGKAFYTTDLLSGSTFAEVWRAVGASTPEWPLHKALEILIRVAEVMAHAHSRGVVHRDLKPSNAMVGQFGDVRVIDWGSARLLAKFRPDIEEPFVHIATEQVQTDRDDSLLPDLPTGVAGQPMTISFMPPEILAGHFDQLGPETDIYSMGVMLYELLAHRLPFANDKGHLPEQKELVELIKTTSPTPVRDVNPSTSRDLAAITEKAMARQKSNRYRSMNDFAEDIRAAMEIRPVRARKPTVLLRIQKLAQRNASHVLLICVILGIIAISISALRTLEVQKEAARQVTAVRNAELAARNGHWREDLRYLDNAEAAGYDDKIFLGLQRAEAWTALNEPDRAGAELRKLMRRSDLSARRGSVLLKMGDYELFDQATANQGVEHVRQALAAGLNQADQFVAQGLLAQSVPEALDSFQQALRIDPYSYSAHIHGLGMEFVLGRHADLATHIRVFLILYPDDPSPRFLKAMESALAGRLDEAAAALEPLRQTIGNDSWNKLIQGYRNVNEAARCFRIDALLPTNSFDSRKLSKVMTDAGSLLTASLADSNAGVQRLREPRLPCLEHGLLDAVTAVRALNVPFYKDITPFVEQIKASWRLCPEAVLPFRAATLLEMRHPPGGPKSAPLLAIQAELFQMAADSPSFVPELPRSARYLATKADLELIQSQPTKAGQLRNNCLRNIQAAVEDKEISSRESRAYFDIAVQLFDYSAAKRFLERWDKTAPNDPDLVRKRIELEIDAGNFPRALQLIDRLLMDVPDDLWAKQQQSALITQLTELIGSATSKALKQSNHEEP
jgi:serine/threonine protein kinase